MKKILSLGLAICLSIGVLAGCKKNDEKADSSKSSQEITLMVPDWGDPGKEILDEFEKESGIKVKVTQVSWDKIKDKISTAAAGKTVAADVFEVDWSWVGEFKNAGWVDPIDVSEEDKKDMPSISTFSVDGKVYAIPYGNDFRVAFYNKEDYDKAGLKDAPKTWEDVIDDAKVIKLKGVKEYPVTMPLGAEEGTSTVLYWLAYTRNGKVFNDDNTINKAAVLDALKIIDKLNKEGLIDPANRNSSGMDGYMHISDDTASFMVGPSYFVSGVNDPQESKVVDKVESVKLPGKDDYAKATVPFAEALGISKYTKNREAAEKFVKWYTSKETQEKLFLQKNIAPTRTSVLQKLVKDGKYKNPGAMLELAEVIESPFPNGVPSYYSKMTTEIYNTINQMANEKLTPEQATDMIVEKVDALAKADN